MSKSELNESSLSRLWGKVQESDCALISAFRKEYTKEQNLDRSRKLQGALRAAGYSVTAVRGAFIENRGTPEEREVKENSFFVQNIENSAKFINTITALGEHWKQDAVLIIPKGGKGAYLIGTSNSPDAYLRKGEKDVVGNATYGKVTQEYFTKVGGRGFEFKQADVISEKVAGLHEDLTPTSAWVRSRYYKRVLEEALKKQNETEE